MGILPRKKYISCTYINITLERKIKSGPSCQIDGGVSKVEPHSKPSIREANKQ